MNGKTRKKKIDKMEVLAVASGFIALAMIITTSISNRIEEAKVIELTEGTGSETETTQVWFEDCETKQPKHYELTEAERTLIEQVVSAESRGEPYDGQVAVAQCILNACLKEDIRPAEVIETYGYTSVRVEPTDSVKKAVAAVFERGEGVTEEPILYFYTPALCTSDWHEAQTFVIEIANHRFFKEV